MNCWSVQSISSAQSGHLFSSSLLIIAVWRLQQICPQSKRLNARNRKITLNQLFITIDESKIKCETNKPAFKPHTLPHAYTFPQTSNLTRTKLQKQKKDETQTLTKKYNAVDRIHKNKKPNFFHNFQIRNGKTETCYARKRNSQTFRAGHPH